MKIIETSKELFKDFLPKRNEETSKFDYGRAFLIGGSKEYGGAPLLSLSSLMALRMGAGFSTLYVPEPLYSIYIGRNPQTILSLFPSEDDKLVFNKEFLDKLMSKASSIAIGMGVTSFKECSKVLDYLLHNYKGKLIIDAGGLESLSLLKDPFENKTCDVIITPHEGEFARLLNISRDKVHLSGIQYAYDYAERNDLTIILKGHTSIITSGKEIVYLNKTGNTGLAKAGSGDLLSGILCGIFAQNVPQTDTLKAVFSSYLLGASADYLLKEESEYSIIADDIVRAIPFILKDFVKA